MISYIFQCLSFTIKHSVFHICVECNAPAQRPPYLLFCDISFLLLNQLPLRSCDSSCLCLPTAFVCLLPLSASCLRLSPAFVCLLPSSASCLCLPPAFVCPLPLCDLWYSLGPQLAQSTALTWFVPTPAISSSLEKLSQERQETLPACSTGRMMEDRGLTIIQLLFLPYDVELGTLED